MGLGGLTRDSIVGLNNLVHDDDDDGQGNYGGNSNEYEHQGHRRNLSLNNGSKSFGVTSGNAGHCGDFLFIDGQLQESQNRPAEQSVALTSLNDCGKETGRPQRQSSFQGQPGRPTASSSASPRVAAEAHSGTTAAYQFHYEDYTDYYAEDFAPYNYDYDYGYDGFAEGRGEEGEGKNIFCCLFAPWLAKARPETIDRDEGEGNKADALQSAPDLQNEATLQQQQQQQQATSSIDDSSSKSDMEIEESKRTQNESSVVAPSSLALALAHPSSAATTPSKATAKATAPTLESQHSSISETTSGSDEEKKEAEQDKQSDDHPTGPKQIKSILKVKRALHTIDDASNGKSGNKNGLSTTPTSKDGKRHLFPTYEPKKSHGNGSDNSSQESSEKSIHFNPMARVLTIPSRKDIPFSQKRDIWWQKTDYDEFKKTGRIISKAMECGGSEIWLNSSNAWGNRQQSKQLQDSIKTNEGTTTASAASAVSDEEYNQALRKYGINDEKKDDAINDNDDTNDAESDATINGNKWWCKFGHSRRGLEHIASNEEGKARQQSVLLAIRMVLEEQRRQRTLRTKDPNKLRTVAIQYTSWARDLALAAGTADAEAVKTNFDVAAKSRAHYFAKKWNTASSSSSSSSSTSMLSSSPSTGFAGYSVDWNAVGGGVARAVTSQILDENTHARKKAISSNTTEHHRRPLNGDSDHVDTISKKAKGFSGGGGGNDDMSAVLTGMGASRMVKA